MATNSGSGSLLFKIIIAVLAVVLILLIKIPNSIWNEEKTEKIQSQFNISSIYEAEKYYYRLTNKYTSDKNELLDVIKKDSTLYQTQQLVNYTQELATVINGYLTNELINNYLTISQTLEAIISELETNGRYFKINNKILSTSEDLIAKLSVFQSDVNHSNYTLCISYLDTLYQLRRDMSDYSLQTAAAKSANITEKANSFLKDIEIENISSEWLELSARIKDFRLEVKYDDNVSKNTSVSDKLKDYVEKIDLKIGKLKSINNSENINSAVASHSKIDEIYKTFLENYLITSKYGMYRLSLEDSMVLYISPDNFLSPVSNQEYVLQINSDSTDIKVESPLLVMELKNQLIPSADKISGLEFTSHYIEFRDSLKAVYDKGLSIKAVIRRDLDITIKNKEIEETIIKYTNGSEHTAALSLNDFVKVVNGSNSYSELKESIEKGRNAIGIFKQVYEGNVFDNIDSLNVEMKAHIVEFNKILEGKRKLPKEITKFEINAFKLDQIADKIKAQASTKNVQLLVELQSDLDEALLFASEGKTISVYGIFEKARENFGYIYKNAKSWEED